MPRLILRLLGAPQVRTDTGHDVPSVMGSAKIMALLAYLATAPSGLGRRREMITALLWPERDCRHARHALRQLLTRLRHAGGRDVLACTTAEVVCLDPAASWVDTAALEEAVAAECLEDIVGLYTGTFLEGFHLPESAEFESWTDETRHRYERTALDAADGLAAQARAARDRSGEVRWLGRALEIDPFSEARSERLVALFLESGERGRALAERERLRRRFEGDLGLVPCVEPIPPEPLRPAGDGPGPSTSGPGPLAAGEEVRRGRYHFRRWSAESMERALAHFTRAQSLAPDDPSAHAGLALTYGVLGHFGHLPPDIAFPRAEASASRALALEDRVPEAHLALGMKAHIYDRCIGAAFEHLGEARDAAPDDALPHWAMGLLHASLEQFDEARACLRRARLLDPLALPVTTGEAWVHIGAGDIEAAEHSVWNTLELDPDAPQALWQLGIVREMQGNPAEAATHFRRALARSPADPLILASLGHALATAGDEPGSHRIVQRLRRMAQEGTYVPPLALAMVHAGRGEVGDARAALVRGLAEHDGFIAFLAPWPFTRSLHDEPWFGALRDGLFTVTAAN